METVPNRKKPTLTGNGALLVSALRNRPRTVCPGRRVWLGGSPAHRVYGPEVGPPSNVTIRMKSSLIREGTLLPPLVRRCLGGVVPIVWAKPLTGNEVIQRQRTGRVAQVGVVRASGWKPSRAEPLQGSGGAVPVSVWRRIQIGTTKERTGVTPETVASGASGATGARGKPNINHVHYWLKSNAPWEGSQCGYLRLSLARGPQVATSGRSARAEEEKERRDSV
jgi:hypothetical protein